MMLSALLFCLTCWIAAPAPNPPVPPDTVVFCPDSCRQALQQWLEYRRTQGHRIAVVGSPSSAKQITRQVREYSESGKLKTVIIIGDSKADFLNRRSTSITPTGYVDTQIIHRFGPERQIASDNDLVDLDDDGVADFQIGRLPVDSPRQLTALIDKIIRYEQRPPGAWNRQINLVAGASGFNPLYDRLIENAVRGIVTELIPSDFHTTMTQANWSSVYCPDPTLLRDTVLERMNEGCLFWVYMGHSHARLLEPLVAPDGSRFPLLLARDTDRVECHGGSPIAIFLSCYTGAIDFDYDSIGEQLVNNPCGPVAVLCGSRVTMPYGNALFGIELINAYSAAEHRTLGALFHAAKSSIVKPAHLGKHRAMIDLLANSVGPSAGRLSVERHEHVQLYHLLGDPLTRLPTPKRIELEAELRLDESKLLVSGNLAHAGHLLVELVYPRNRLKFRAKPRNEFNQLASSLRDMHETYRKANDCVCAQVSLVAEDAGRFSTAIEIPQETKGPCVVRALLFSDAQFSVGSLPLKIDRR